MKKFLSVLIALIMLLSVLPASVSAEELESSETETETFTLYAYVPSGWDSPCFYGWGGSLSMSWPGAAMTPVEDGWYSYVVAADAEGLIVNACDGTVQTPDIKQFEPKDMWVVVNADTTCTIYYEKPEIELTEPAEPEASAAEDTAAAEVEPAAAENAFSFADAACYAAAAVIIAAAAFLGARLGSKKAKASK